MSIYGEYGMDLIKSTYGQANSLARYNYGRNKASQTNVNRTKTISEIKRKLSGNRKDDMYSDTMLDAQKSYGESIRESRNNAKATATQVKKLKYNFKKISSQIRNSKTSASARQVASAAHREVIKLKQKMQTGKYDNEELEAAIDHAKSMERAAKRKARHLEEEELIKITDKYGNSEEKEGSEASDAIAIEEQMEERIDAAYEEMDEVEKQRMEAYMEMMQEMAEESMEDSMEESLEEVSDEMYDLMAESMDDMLEDTMENLMDGMMIVTDSEMDKDEFKKYQLKHRTAEDKAMLEADMKYLKAMFDMYQKGLESKSADISVGSGIGAGIDIGVNEVSGAAFDIQNVVDISL